MSDIDVMDGLADLTPGSPLGALRRQRPEVMRPRLRLDLVL